VAQSIDSRGANSLEDEGPMRMILFAAFVSLVGNMGTAEACSYRTDSGWTSTGGGTAAALTVLGSETCQGKIQGIGLQVIAPPRHGKVRITGPSTYVYTPNRAYRGTDVINLSAKVDGVGLVVGSIVVIVE
jgi:hypothetical protein